MTWPRIRKQDLRQYMVGLVLGAFAACGFLLVSCSKEFPDEPTPNRPPETHLHLQSTHTLNTTTSQQVLHWWGDDPDGLVVGFLYTFDSAAEVPASWKGDSVQDSWTFTTEQSDTFGLKFVSQDTVFTFRVSAVDDEGAVDPTPAEQQFPVRNTPPEVEFILNSDVPETTFTVAAFSWQGSDLDGDETIVAYEWALDDTASPTSWHRIPGDVNFLLLQEQDGLTEGDHVFYLRAVDISGSRSRTIRMPRLPDQVWHVRKPRTDVLLVDDYGPVDASASFYAELMSTLFGEFDLWDIKADRDRDNRADLLPPAPVAFEATLKLFKLVVWYTDQSAALEYAQIAVPGYLKQGGKLIMSASFPEFFSGQGDPLEFSPVDSLGSTISRVLPNTRLLPFEAEYDTLETSYNVFFVKPLVPKPSARALYRLEPGPRWEGEPTVAVIDGTRSFVFFGMPLHNLDKRGNVSEVIARIVTTEFGLSP